MSYRKIEINGKTYFWTVGRKYLKIKGMNPVKVEDVGTPVEGTTSFVVSQRNVKNYILGKGKPQFSCKWHGVKNIKEFTINPFSIEVWGKKSLMINCPCCYREESLAI